MTVVHLVSNPVVASRKRIRAVDAVRASFQARGHDVVDLRPSSLELIVPTLIEARHDGVTRLVIAGGDGLLHQCLPAISESDVPVGVIPIGTGNDFARALGLPNDPIEAVEAALRDPVPIDLIAHSTAGPDAGAETSAAGESAAGESGAGLVATVVTGGFSGRVTARANGLRYPKGQLRYTVATLIELAKLEATAVELAVDGETHRLEASLFALGNTRYFGGGMAVCPAADPTDGVIDVTVVGPASSFELARVLPTVFSGRHVDHPSVSTYRGARIDVTTSAELWADGENLDSPIPSPNRPVTPVTTSFTTVPGALLVAGSLGST